MFPSLPMHCNSVKIPMRQDTEGQGGNPAWQLWVRVIFAPVSELPGSSRRSRHAPPPAVFMGTHEQVYP